MGGRGFQKCMGGRGFRKCICGRDFRKYVSGRGFQKCVGGSGFRKCVGGRGFRGYVGGKSVDLGLQTGPALALSSVLPERFETFPVNLTLRLNDTAMFECRCPGIQAPRVEWFLNGSPVWAGQRIVLYDSGTLEIHQLTLSDIGEYYCRVTNKAGSLSSPGGHLTLALSGEC